MRLSLEVCQPVIVRLRRSMIKKVLDVPCFMPKYVCVFIIKLITSSSSTSPRLLPLRLSCAKAHAGDYKAEGDKAKFDKQMLSQATLVNTQLKEFRANASAEFDSKPDCAKLMRTMDQFLYGEEISLDVLAQQCADDSIKDWTDPTSH